MELFSVEYGMIFLLLVVWVIMSVLVLKFWSNKRVKGGAIALFGLLVLSMYENVHLYNTYLRSSENRMQEAEAHLDSAVRLVKKGDTVEAALQVATAGGEMNALGNTPDGRIIHGNAAQLRQLGKTLQVQIAPSIAKSKSDSTRQITFVEYADKVFDEANKYPRYSLPMLHSQLQKIAQHEPS